MKNLNELASDCVYKECKICGIEHKRFKGDIYPNGKDFKFVNEEGREWSGRVCPQCHSTRNAKRQKKKRKVRKLYV